MNNKGFTLIELIMVIAVLLIVAGIGAPNLMDSLHRQQEEADDMVAVQLTDATESYALVSGQSLVSTDSNFVFKDCKIGGTLDTEMMLDKLMENGFIIAYPDTEQNNAEFRWYTAAMEWRVDVN